MIDDGEKANSPAYDFTNPVNSKMDSNNDPFYQELVCTTAFQRLKEIRFLGGIDYLAVRAPNGTKTRYTRYQHSLGVAHLALLYAHSRDLNPVDRRLIYAAALLHDVGHAPLSHSLESVFYEQFGIDHHQATEEIISGRATLGSDLNNCLRIWKIDADQIIEIINGQDNTFNEFFSGPINFDTVEGILRSQTYANPNSLTPNPETVINSAIDRKTNEDQRIVDEFWTYKDEVYRTIINSRFGILADYACRLHMSQNLDKITADDYYTTEKGLFRKLPELRKLLISKSFSSLIQREIDEPIPYRVRHFFINQSSDFFERKDTDRYKQTKTDRFLSADVFDIQSNQEVGQDLFDDDRIRTKQEIL